MQKLWIGSLGWLWCVLAVAQPALVPTGRVQVQARTSVLELDGVIQAVQQSTVSAQAAGRIVTFLVKTGDAVRAGQLIATIDAQEAQVSLDKSQAQMRQAQAELANAQAALTRTQDLQKQGFLSKAAADAAQTQYASALAQRDQAAAAAAQSRIAQTYTRVLAPYAGWVLQTHAQAGDLALPGKPLVTVYMPQPLRAVVQVPSAQLHRMRNAAQTLVQTNGGATAMRWIAPVSRYAAPAADAVTQTTEWRLDLPPVADAAWLPGQQVRVRIVAAGAEDAGPAQPLVVPLAAVLQRGELTAVYLASAHGFSLRAVRLGQALGPDAIEVLAGVRAGDWVALDPIRAGLAGAKPQQFSK